MFDIVLSVNDRKVTQINKEVQKFILVPRRDNNVPRRDNNCVIWECS